MLSEKKPKLAMIKIMFTVIKYNIFFLTCYFEDKNCAECAAGTISRLSHTQGRSFILCIICIVYVYVYVQYIIYIIIYYILYICVCISVKKCCRYGPFKPEPDFPTKKIKFRILFCSKFVKLIKRSFFKNKLIEHDYEELLTHFC